MPEQRYTPLDLVGLGAAALSMLFSAMGALQLAPTFAAMFDDLGGALPLLTRLFLNPLVPISLGAVPALAVGAAIASRAAPKARAVASLFAVAMVFLLPALFLIAMYLPLFAISAAVR